MSEIYLTVIWNFFKIGLKTSKKVSCRIVFEDYIYQYDAREKYTVYYFCIYKKTAALHVVLNIKAILARMQHNWNLKNRVSPN